MSNPFAQECGPQPPKVLKAPLEIIANLRLLQHNHDPLILIFQERNQRFQSYVIEIDRERNLLVLDEMIPSDGERYLQNGEPFSIESMHDGVRIAWDCPTGMRAGEYQGERCYIGTIPAEVHYHQRRNAFRAALRQSEQVTVQLSGTRLRAPLEGLMLDISASGCKIRLAGDTSQQLQPGQIYEDFCAQLPVGKLEAAVELRHARYDDKLDVTLAGLHFANLSGLQQRLIERFVYQLQREARRFESESFL
ncbi:pilus assembly protein PilZ [Pseudomonas argentinensis]|uniref:C-di-GMP-binding flagellar brake protein YcgR, contains PilZNR and PilZ domains n=1 Tax=Phytopseudomonas argentinensis TaxID=289370 RepID=A0A1I3H2Q0_9GAMM|nr:flagellar brake protein [Pseudomonas argentinensis]KAB0548705.1 pilus assembly protein PilZ [Pseudomonas argentinensis]SFI29959.1 c-di-GMP-binding flagellar brake protein YcgR, contains PilZNR and PilZ domains [Pseudomonas argentinensis]